MNINAPCNNAENLSKIAHANSASIVLITKSHYSNGIVRSIVKQQNYVSRLYGTKKRNIIKVSCTDQVYISRFSVHSLSFLFILLGVVWAEVKNVSPYPDRSANLSLSVHIFHRCVYSSVKDPPTTNSADRWNSVRRCATQCGAD